MTMQLALHPAYQTNHLFVLQDLCVSPLLDPFSYFIGRSIVFWGDFMQILS